MNKLFTVNRADIIKGAFVAAVSAVLTFVYALASTPGFTLAQLNPKGIGIIALIAFLAYLSKQFVSSTAPDGTEKVAGIPLPMPPSAS